MAQAGYTPIVIYHSTTASAVPTAGNLAPGELALNINDMKLYCENSSGAVTLLASASGASGDVVGPASATDTAVALFDGTTGKLLKNSAVTVGTTGNTVISGTDNSNAMLRITQLGTGDALLVEDSANPDSTPFVVDASGRLVVGNTSALTATGGVPNIQYVGSAVPLGVFGFNSTAATGAVTFARSKSATIGTNAALVSGDQIAAFRFQGADGGTAYLDGAQILAVADGSFTPTSSPGRLVFSTTADGASSPTERMRITNSGSVGVGGTPTAGRTFEVQKAVTGGVNGYSIVSRGEVQSDVTGSATYNWTFASTQNASFTLSQLRHNYAQQGTFGASSTVTNQYGYFADSSLTGATNNYGFYSNIASGTGRWNFYANGTADNFFGGPTTISVNSATDALRITQTGAGNALVVEDSANPDATPFVVDTSGQVLMGLTTARNTFSGGTVTPAVQIEQVTGGRLSVTRNSANSTAPDFIFGKTRGTALNAVDAVASGDNLGTISFQGADGTNLISAANIIAAVDGTPGTNDMPGRLVFSTTADGASTPTERMRITSSGAIGINASAPSATQGLFRIAQSLTGNAITFGVLQGGTVQSDVTTSATGFTSTLNTAASAFTLGNLRHFFVTQGTIGATSSVTNQYGFLAESTLTGATNNYGFYSNIASGTGRYNFYANGTADNFFGGSVGVKVIPSAFGGDLDVAGTLTNFVRASNDANGFTFKTNKTRATSVYTNTAVQNGDVLGGFQFAGADGTGYIVGSQILSRVAATPGTNDMPTDIVFSTTPDGSATTAERFSVKSQGQCRFFGLTADPTRAEAGDVYYNSSTNKLKVYNGTSWVDLH